MTFTSLFEQDTQKRLKIFNVFSYLYFFFLNIQHRLHSSPNFKSNEGIYWKVKTYYLPIICNVHISSYVLAQQAKELCSHFSDPLSASTGLFIEKIGLQGYNFTLKFIFKVQRKTVCNYRVICGCNISSVKRGR